MCRHKNAQGLWEAIGGKILSGIWITCKLNDFD